MIVTTLVFIALVGIVNYLDLQDQIDAVSNVDLSEFGFSRDGLGASIGIGVYLVILGGAIAGVCAFLDSSRPKAVEAGS